MTPSPSILMLITNLGVGGAQRVFNDHGRLLSRDFEVLEATFNATSKRHFLNSNVLISLEVGGGGGWAQKMINFLKRVKRTRALKTKHRFDVAISHLEGADYVNILSRTRERIIIVAHGSKVRDVKISGLSGFIRKAILLPLLYNRADRIVAVSRDLRDELVELGIAENKLVVINNFFDLDRIKTLAAEPLSQDEEQVFCGSPLLVTCGRLDVQKNQASLLHMIARLRRQRPVRLMVVGDGDLYGALVAEASELGLRVWTPQTGVPDSTFDVYLVGMKQNPFKYISRADLFLFPSLYEGFPLALCEAMACGTPVLSSDCPTGPREILDTGPLTSERNTKACVVGSGVLLPIPVEASAIAIWVDTIDHMLSKPALSRDLAFRALNRVEDFSEKKIAHQWIELVTSVIDSRK